MALKSKILIVGPPGAGKTVISNFLSESTEAYTSNYYPTKGVRILEFEHTETVREQSVKVDVELWDCGGSQECEGFWPVFSKDAQGIIIVYNPVNAKHEKEIEKWYRYFIKLQKLGGSRCILFAHHKPDEDPTEEWQVPTALQNIRCIHTNLDNDPQSVRQAFNSFMNDLVSVLKETQEKEELGIMGKKRT